MASHRSPGGQAPSPELDTALDGAAIRVRGAHRIPAPSSALRGRVVVAAVAAGAFAAAAAGQTFHAFGAQEPDQFSPLANPQDASASFARGGDAPAGAPELLPPELLPATHQSDAVVEVQKLTDSETLTKARQEREAAAARAAEEEARRPKTCLPTKGTFSSRFGARWGTIHYGIDIAAPIGTPIYAASDGTVIDAGPASGFGLWVRIQLDDGTIHVYGHMKSYNVRKGQKVKCGEQIAEVGARGQATGPHLHFEVWQNGTKKIDPQRWLAERGVEL